MSSKYLNHRVFPLATANNYTPNQNVDFRVTFPGRKMVAGSLRIEGRFNCFKTGTTKLINTDIGSFFDNVIGANCLFQDYTTSTQNQGNLEIINEAPRWTKMVMTASTAEGDLSNSSHSSELKSQNIQLSNRIMKGEIFVGQDPTVDPNLAQGMSFSVRPQCCINNATSPAGLPLIKNGTTGDITFTVKLARNDAVFFGSDVASAGSNFYNYNLSELSVSYTSVPDDNQPQAPLTMSTVHNVRQTAQSTFTNVSVNVAQMSNACSMSFLRQYEENSPAFNNTKLDKPPLVTQCEFLFNDSSNKYLTFNLKSEEEILDRYLLSLSSLNKNQLSKNKIKGNEAYGVGINFNGMIDLSLNKFGINMTSNIASNSPYIIYLYFHGLIQL